MDGIVKQIVGFLETGITFILQMLEFIWRWSFGQIVTVMSSDWQALPIWKIAILAIVLLAIAYILYTAGRQIWSATETLFKAFVGLLAAFVSVLPHIVVAGVIAFAGGWAIQNLNF